MKKFAYLMILAVLVSCGPKLDEVTSEKYPDGKPKRVDFYTGEGEGRYIAKSVFYYESGN